MKRMLAIVMAGLILISMMGFAFNLVRPNVARVQASTTDWWPTFHHDASRAGYTTSPGPNAGTVQWQYPVGYVTYSGPAVADGEGLCDLCKFWTLALMPLLAHSYGERT